MHAFLTGATIRRISSFRATSLWVAALCLCLLLNAGNATAAAAIKLSNQFPPQHHVSKGLQVFADKVKEYSNGEMEVKIFDSGSLFRDAEIVKAIRNGSTEIGLVPVNKWSGILPAVDIFEVPFTFTNLQSLEQFLNSGAAPLFDEAFAKYGAKVLFWVDYGYVQFFNSKRPLRAPADFNGLTMRAFSAGDAEILKALGAAPTIISSSELYMALQRGTIDGTTTGMPAAVARKVTEVQKYMTLANYSTAEFLVQANQKWWNGLDNDQQEILAKASQDAEAFIRQEVAKAEDEALAAIRAAGLMVHELSSEERRDFVQATAALRDSYLAKSGELGAKLMPIADQLPK
ncbi:MAG: TRAP transporter substrate-binding protein DctP [Desulfobulbus sp.]|jgi:C4-dicarboxylate-binding protein DctP